MITASGRRLSDVNEGQLALITKTNQERINEIRLRHDKNEPITRNDIEFLLWRARP